MTANDAAQICDLIEERHSLIQLADSNDFDAGALFDLESELFESLLGPIFDAFDGEGLESDLILSAAIFMRDELDNVIEHLMEDAGDEDALDVVRSDEAAADPRMIELMAEVVERETLEAADPADALALLVAQVETGRYLCESPLHNPRLCAIGKQVALDRLGDSVEVDRSSELWARALWCVQSFGVPMTPVLSAVS